MGFYSFLVHVSCRSPFPYQCWFLALIGLFRGSIYVAVYIRPLMSLLPFEPNKIVSPATGFFFRGGVAILVFWVFFGSSDFSQVSFALRGGGVMGKLRVGKVLDFLCISSSCSYASCLCKNSQEEEDGLERKALIGSEGGEIVRIKDIIDQNQTLAFHLKPKTVVLRVSMHCDGCARRVEKHIKKMEGVTSFEVDLESRKVVVIGDIVPFEVLESVSKVKAAELWSNLHQ